MAAGGEGGYHYHLNIARGRGREYHYTPAGGGGGYPNPQIPAGGGGGYPKPQIPAEGGYPNPQIPAGGGGGYPKPQIPAEGGYPNPQIPAGGGGGYPKPQIPAEGGYPNPQIPGGGGGGYPKPQIPAEGGYPNPQIPAGGGGGYPKPQIPAEIGYTNPQIPAGGGGGYPKPQIPAEGGYPNPQIPGRGGGGGGYPKPQIPAEGGYPNPQIPAGGGGGYPKPQIPAEGGYPNPQIPAGGEGGGGGCPNPQIPAGGIVGGHPDPQLPAGGRGRQCHYPQIPGGGGGGYPYHQIHVKEMLVTMGRFRAEQVPPWIDTRKEIFRIYNNLQNYGVSPFTVDESMHPSKINLLWTQLESALLHQQVTLQREIDRLEGLHLLEWIEKEAHHLEGRLDNLEHVLGGEGRQHNAAKSTEGKEKSVLDGELKDIDNHVASLVNHLLMAGFSDVHPVHNRVLCIGRRAGNMQTALDNNATQKPPPGPSANKILMTAQYQQSYNGAQMVESTNALQYVKFCFQWIFDKHALLEGAEYGDSIDSVKQALDLHQKEHQEIISFKTEVDKCVTDRKKLTLEEQQPYEKWLSQVQLMYPVLHKLSCQRQEWLVSLQEFLHEATGELVWMDEKQALACEFSRRLDEFSISDEQMYKTLVQEITNRKSQIKSLQDRGYTMIIDKHPATETVEVYISRTESKWSWLQQLLNCLDKHIREICAYHQFFQEVQSCEQWINQQTESVNNYMKLEKIKFKKLEQMKIECQDLQNALVEYEERVAFLAKTSHDIIPLKQWNHQNTSPAKVYSLCIYDHPERSLQLHEECSLIDTSQESHWVVIQEAISYLQSKQSPTNKFTEFLVHRVLLCEVIATTGSIEFFTHTANNVSTLVILEYMRSTEIGLLPVINSHGQQVTVPSICMIIPPPNLEAISHANRLKTLLEQLKTLVKICDRMLHENIVMSTTKFIKTWDLGMFQSLDPTTCQVLVRDLNDGAAKLIVEAGDADQKMQLQVKKDLDECNRKVQEFSKKLSEEVCEERQPDKTNNTAVDRGQSPQTSDENKPNVTKTDGAHPVKSLGPASISDLVTKFGAEMVNRETRLSAKIANEQHGFLSRALEALLSLSVAIVVVASSFNALISCGEIQSR